MKQKKDRGAFGIKLTGLLINGFIIVSLIAALTSGFKLVSD